MQSERCGDWRGCLTAISYPGYESVEVGAGRQVYGHDVRDVAVEGLQDSPGLDVPEGGGGVPRAGQDLVV